jgi:O-antigen/teichoic acid export membrane protein
MSASCEAVLEKESRPAKRREGPISVASGFAWVLAGYVAYMACQWGMIVALARWGTVETVGQFHLALATTAPIIMFTNLGLRRVYATDARSAFRFGDYLGLRFLTCGIALVVIAGFAVFSGHTAAMAGVILAMGAAKSIEAVSDVLHGYFQNRRRIDIGARSTLMRGPLSLLGLIAAFLLTRSAFWAVVGMASGWLAVVLLYDLPRAARLRRQETDRKAPAGSAKSKLSLARLSLPLGVVALITSLRANIPTFVIAAYLGERWLGLFGALVYFHAASNRVVSALGEAGTTPLAARYLAGDRTSYLRLLAKMTGVTLAVSLAGLAIAAVAGRAILGAFYGQEYAAVSAVLVAVMAAVAVANVQTILDYAMTAARQLGIQPYLYGGGALLLFLLCLAFIPTHGIRGAALALGIGSVVELVASAVIVGRAVSQLRQPAPRPVLEAR